MTDISAKLLWENVGALKNLNLMWKIKIQL